MTDADYVFERNGRSWPTLVAVLITWTLCVLAWVLIDAAPWILTIVLLFTVPALWDLWSGRRSGLSLGSGQLRWFSGSIEDGVPFGQIDHLRLVTRLDLSVRAAVIMKSGSKLRIPAESTPPAAAFEAALTKAGIAHQRHHFTYL